MEESLNSPALMRLRNKPKAPRIDFSVYTQEDGTIVNTKDRIIKGTHTHFRDPLF